MPKGGANLRGKQASILVRRSRPGGVGVSISPGFARRWIGVGKADMNATVHNIEEHPFFEGMKPDYVALAARESAVVDFDPGDIVFHEGEPANRFYLILNGGLLLEAHDPLCGTVEIERIGGGDVLGWSWLHPPFVWHFRARVIEPVRAIVLDGGHLLATSEQEHEFGYEFHRRISKIVIHRLQISRKRLLSLSMQAKSGVSSDT